jgi:Zn-dependent protease with chaperone function
MSLPGQPLSYTLRVSERHLRHCSRDSFPVECAFVIAKDTATTYRAMAIQQGTARRMVAGHVRLEEGRLKFAGADVTVEMPVNELQLRAGGQNDEQLFFEHSSQTTWVLTTSDHAILGPLTGMADPQLQERIRQAGRGKSVLASRFRLAVIVTIGVLVGSVLLLFSQKGRIARLAARQVPVSVEAQFGDAVFQSVQRQTTIITDPRWTAQLAPVTSRLLLAATNSGYTFRFHVAEGDELNAFAIPGGHMVVYTGLLKAVQRPEELAGVLAHEMAHVMQRHTLRTIIETLGLSLMVQTLLGDASGLVALAGEGSRVLLNQRFSREVEREADDAGWELLLAANIDPRGMIEFFRTMQTELAKNPASAAADGKLSFLSTHPATSERIERLEARFKALPDKTGFVPLRAPTARP